MKLNYLYFSHSFKEMDHQLATEPDVYVPNIDEDGHYVDKVGAFCKIRDGIKCPCTSHKDQHYLSMCAWNSHIKTKIHQQWLKTLNANKANYYAEVISLNKTIYSQKQIIARLDNELQASLLSVHHLSHALLILQPPNDKNNMNHIDGDGIDLLDFENES